MNKIRRKNQKPNAAAADKGEVSAAPAKGGSVGITSGAEKASSGPGGFTEQDIEFMKKAI